MCSRPWRPARSQRSPLRRIVSSRRPRGPRRPAPSRGGVPSGLGGRFFEALRARQSLAYTVIATPVVRPLAGLFVTYIATSPEKEDDARRGLLAEIEKLRAEPVDDEELPRARTFALGSWAIRQES